MEDEESQTQPPMAHNGLNPPNVDHHEPRTATIAEQLQAMRDWYNLERDKAELARLLEIKRRTDNGDLTALNEDPKVPPRSGMVAAVQSQGTPRPKDPTSFSNRDRMQYNCWSRDCEAIFVGAPQSFLAEERKIHFAVRFISEPMRVAWEGSCNEQLHSNPLWLPTWDHLKAVMLNCLGPEAIRRLAAHAALKSLKQAPDQDPNDLHAELHVLWSEMGPTYPEDQKKMDLLGALLPRIQRELLAKDQTQFVTSTALVVAARFQWNKTNSDNLILNKLNPVREERTKSSFDVRAGNSQTRKRVKRTTMGHASPKPPRRGHSGQGGAEKACWNCGKSGHLQKDCRQPEKPKSDLTDSAAGKGKGRRS